MRVLQIFVSLFLFSFLEPRPVLGQAGSSELPSLGTAVGTIYISNPTNGRVIFYLETKNTARRQHSLDPQESATFTGVAGDDWFNIEARSAGGTVSYGLDSGSRHYFEWRGNVLDIFKLPPR